MAPSVFCVSERRKPMEDFFNLLDQYIDTKGDRSRISGAQMDAAQRIDKIKVDMTTALSTYIGMSARRSGV
jgi:hypothetical protein